MFCDTISKESSMNTKFETQYKNYLFEFEIEKIEDKSKDKDLVSTVNILINFSPVPIFCK